MSEGASTQEMILLSGTILITAFILDGVFSILGFNEFGLGDIFYKVIIFTISSSLIFTAVVVLNKLITRSDEQQLDNK
jgi:hypothetical protein